MYRERERLCIIPAVGRRRGPRPGPSNYSISMLRCSNRLRFSRRDKERMSEAFNPQRQNIFNNTRIPIILVESNAAHINPRQRLIKTPTFRTISPTSDV